MDGNVRQFMIDRLMKMLDNLGWKFWTIYDGQIDGNFERKEILDTHLDGWTHISQFSSPAVNTIRHHTTCCDSCPDL